MTDHDEHDEHERLMRRSREGQDAPSVAACRHAVLQIKDSRPTGAPGYVIYDRLFSRVVDGVYYNRQMALDVAAHMNTSEGLRGYKGLPPNGVALGLLYPVGFESADEDK